MQTDGTLVRAGVTEAGQFAGWLANRAAVSKEAL